MLSCGAPQAFFEIWSSPFWGIDHAWAFIGTTVDCGVGADDDPLSLHVASNSNTKIDNTTFAIVPPLTASLILNFAVTLVAELGYLSVLVNPPK